MGAFTFLISCLACPSLALQVLPLIALFMPLDAAASVMDGVLLGSQEAGWLGKTVRERIGAGQLPWHCADQCVDARPAGQDREGPLASSGHVFARHGCWVLMRLRLQGAGPGPLSCGAGTVFLLPAWQWFPRPHPRLPCLSPLTDGCHVGVLRCGLDAQPALWLAHPPHLVCDQGKSCPRARKQLPACACWPGPLLTASLAVLSGVQQCSPCFCNRPHSDGWFQGPPPLQFLTVGRLIGNAYRLWSRNGPLAGELRAAAA